MGIYTKLPVSKFHGSDYGIHHMYITCQCFYIHGYVYKRKQDFAHE